MYLRNLVAIVDSYQYLLATSINLFFALYIYFRRSSSLQYTPTEEDARSSGGDSSEIHSRSLSMSSRKRLSNLFKSLSLKKRKPKENGDYLYYSITSTYHELIRIILYNLTLIFQQEILKVMNLLIIMMDLITEAIMVER